MLSIAIASPNLYTCAWGVRKPLLRIRPGSYRRPAVHPGRQAVPRTPGGAALMGTTRSARESPPPAAMSPPRVTVNAARGPSAPRLSARRSRRGSVLDRIGLLGRRDAKGTPRPAQDWTGGFSSPWAPLTRRRYYPSSGSADRIAPASVSPFHVRYAYFSALYSGTDVASAHRLPSGLVNTNEL